MTNAAASRQLRDSESETKDTVRVASCPATSSTTAAGESSRHPARSGSKRPAKSPESSPPPPAGKTSTPAADKHIQSSKNSVAPNYKLRLIPKLTRIENYHAWKEISQYVLELFTCWNIVLGEETIDHYAEDDNDNFIDRPQYAATYFSQTVESQWLILLATHKAPPKIWTGLEDIFARGSTSSFFDQPNSVFDTKYDILDLLSNHINKYDILWNRLYLRCSTTSSTHRYTLPFVFQTVFESPQAKAAFLLGSLPESMNNIVDNLQTKEDLTYDHVYNKLMDLKIPTAIHSADNKAYKTADVKGKGKELRREHSRKGPTALPKECSYCKKHYLTARSDGHTWNEGVKLKAANLKK